MGGVFEFGLVNKIEVVDKADFSRFGRCHQEGAWRGPMGVRMGVGRNERDLTKKPLSGIVNRGNGLEGSEVDRPVFSIVELGGDFWNWVDCWFF